MKFQIPRDVILKVLQQLSGVVERRQTLPVLGNILVKAGDAKITLAATDLEVELIVNVDWRAGGRRARRNHYAVGLWSGL